MQLNRGKLFIVLAVFAGILFVAQSFSATGAELPGTLATEMTHSEYDPKDLSLTVQVHASRILVEYEHWGFFRIGLMPILVAENVQVKIQSAQYLANALMGLKSWHRPSLGCRRLELRNLEIMTGGEQPPRLRAVVARVDADGAIALSGVTVCDSAGRQIVLPKAILQISGPSAGRLSWESGGNREELRMLQHTSNKTP